MIQNTHLGYNNHHLTLATLLAVVSPADASVASDGETTASRVDLSEPELSEATEFTKQNT